MQEFHKARKKTQKKAQMKARPARRIARLLLMALALGGFLAGRLAQAGDDDAHVNINAASVEELQQLPGVGASRAEAIVALRTAQGGFTSTEQLLQVKGIGEKSLERMQPYLTLGGEMHTD